MLGLVGGRESLLVVQEGLVVLQHLLSVSVGLGDGGLSVEEIDLLQRKTLGLTV